MTNATQTTSTTPRPSRFNRKLSAEEYNASVKRVGANRFHIASSSRPGSVRDVRLLPDGSKVCSCPAVTPYCKHITAVEDFLMQVELRIAEPKDCRCCGCRPISPNPNGCVYAARADAHQYVNATAA